MIKDVVIEVVRGRVVFSCPHCLIADVFSADIIAGISGVNTAVKCPRCSYMVSINKPKIEAGVAQLVSRDPFLKNPLEVKSAGPPPPPVKETPPTEQPARPAAKDVPAAPVAPTHPLPPREAPAAPGPARPTPPPIQFEKLDADYVIQRVHGDRGTPMPSVVGLADLILVVDREDSFRDDIWIIFSDIARVEGYHGAMGAAQYIKKRKDEITIIMMEVNLGDGSCFSVMDALKDSGAEKIPTIVAYADKGELDIINRGVSSYPQVRAVVQKEELVKKMIELSIKIVKKGE
jgi:hypothetical protein